MNLSPEMATIAADLIAEELHKVQLTIGDYGMCNGLKIPLNTHIEDDDQFLHAAELSVDDSQIGPKLWDFAISVLNEFAAASNDGEVVEFKSQRLLGVTNTDRIGAYFKDPKMSNPLYIQMFGRGKRVTAEDAQITTITVDRQALLDLVNAVDSASRTHRAPKALDVLREPFFPDEMLSGTARTDGAMNRYE